MIFLTGHMMWPLSERRFLPRSISILFLDLAQIVLQGFHRNRERGTLTATKANPEEHQVWYCHERKTCMITANRPVTRPAIKLEMEV
jgi:hypothetical protein